MKVNLVLNLVFSTNNEGKATIFKDKVLKQFPYNFELRNSVLKKTAILWEFDLIAEVDISSYQNSVYETLLKISEKAERYQVTGPKVDEDEYFFMVHWQREYGQSKWHKCLEKLNLMVIRE